MSDSDIFKKPIRLSSIMKIINKITDTSPPYSRRSFLVTGSQTLAGLSGSAAVSIAASALNTPRFGEISKKPQPRKG